MDQVSAPSEPSEAYLTEHVRDALERDPRTCGLEIDVAVEDRSVVLGGTVSTEERRSLVEEVVRSLLPHRAIRNALLVMDLPEPTQAEHLG